MRDKYYPTDFRLNVDDKRFIEDLHKSTNINLSKAFRNFLKEKHSEYNFNPNNQPG
jgi:hypothetical protein